MDDSRVAVLVRGARCVFALRCTHVARSERVSSLVSIATACTYDTSATSTQTNARPRREHGPPRSTAPSAIAVRTSVFSGAKLPPRGGRTRRPPPQVRARRVPMRPHEERCAERRDGTSNQQKMARATRSTLKDAPRVRAKGSPDVVSMPNSAKRLPQGEKTKASLVVRGLLGMRRKRTGRAEVHENISPAKTTAKRKTFARTRVGLVFVARCARATIGNRMKVIDKRSWSAKRKKLRSAVRATRCRPTRTPLRCTPGDFPILRKSATTARVGLHEQSRDSPAQSVPALRVCPQVERSHRKRTFRQRRAMGRRPGRDETPTAAPVGSTRSAQPCGRAGAARWCALSQGDIETRLGEKAAR